MRLFPALAATAVLLTASAASAQEPPAPAPTAAAESAVEAALEARGHAFEARMEQMGAELEAAMADPAADAASKTAATNAIIDRYVPDIEAFATDFETVLRLEADKPENADARADLLAAAAAAPAAIRGIPDQIRAGLQAQINPPAPPVAVPVH